MKRAIIKGEVKRFAMSGKDVQFNIHVVESIIDGEIFTIGTVISCVVPPAKINISDCIIKEGHLIPVKNLPEDKEPYKTALCLAVGDYVIVEMVKDDAGVWSVEGISHKPKLEQDAGEFLGGLEEILEERRKKGLKTH